MRKQKILSLDLGSTMGWAIHSTNGLISSGTTELKNSTFEGGGMRFYKFELWLDEIYRDCMIDLIFYEAVKQRHTSTAAARAYNGFLATLTGWCEKKGVPYEGVTVQTIKIHATGKGNASKDHVINSVKAKGHHPNDDNEADAIALLYWALQNRLRVEEE